MELQELASSSSPSLSSSSTTLLTGGRAIDRYNPIIRDSRRIGKTLPSCNNPQSPISPIPQKKKKNSKTSFKEHGKESKKNDGLAKKLDDEKKKDGEVIKTDDVVVSKSVVTRKSWSCTKPGAFISPPGSTRYLLSTDKVSFNAGSDFDPSLKLFPEETAKPEVVKSEESLEEKPASASDSPDQVVVLRVSLHCRGCERKMRKHLSRMEGVTSFNIDFMAKKVTVTGNVTPLGVLSSISKVKNAQLWSPSITSAVPAVNSSDPVPTKNEYKGTGDAQVQNKENFVSVESKI